MFLNVARCFFFKSRNKHNFDLKVYLSLNESEPGRRCISKHIARRGLKSLKAKVQELIVLRLFNIPAKSK
jgi:hypothetical protein